MDGLLMLFEQAGANDFADGTVASGVDLIGDEKLKVIAEGDARVLGHRVIPIDTIPVSCRTATKICGPSRVLLVLRVKRGATHQPPSGGSHNRPALVGPVTERRAPIPPIVCFQAR